MFPLSPRKPVNAYPFSKRRVYYSCLLVVISILFVTMLDPISVFLFFVWTLVFAMIFLVLKFYLYSKKTQEELDSQYSQEEDRYRGFPRAISLMLIAVFLPILLLFYLFEFLGPTNWIAFIIGLIAGVNIPEIILYLHFR